MMRFSRLTWLAIALLGCGESFALGVAGSGAGGSAATTGGIGGAGGLGGTASPGWANGGGNDGGGGLGNGGLGGGLSGGFGGVGGDALLFPPGELGGECLANKTCNAGECCTANECSNTCMDPCKGNRPLPCPVGMGCEHGYCLFECRSDDDCLQPGFTCQHGGPTYCENDSP